MSGSRIDVHEGNRQALEAVLVAADRFITADDAMSSRDWQTFEDNGLGAVTVEYERLRDAVLELRKRNLVPTSRPARGVGSDPK